MKLALIYGAMTPPGRLASALDAFGSMARDHSDITDVTAMDPQGAVVPGFERLALDAANDPVPDIATAHATIIFSPVYKASLPGSLKSLIDRLPVSALEAKPVGLVAMGASPHHYLGVDAELRRVAAWFGSAFLPTTLYLTGKSFIEGRPTDDTNRDLQRYLQLTIDFAQRLANLELPVRPLAAGSEPE